MKTLDLYKTWQICNKLSVKIQELSEEDKYIYLLGYSSNYNNLSFDSFLAYYSFKIQDNNIIVFNDDRIAYEDFTNNDFSYIPSVLLSFSCKKLDNWIKAEVKLHLEKLEYKKIQEKEDLEYRIEMLKKQLDKL